MKINNDLYFNVIKEKCKKLIESKNIKPTTKKIQEVSYTLPRYSFKINEWLDYDGRIENHSLVGKKFKNTESGKVYKCLWVSYRTRNFLDGFTHSLNLTMVDDSGNLAYIGAWKLISGDSKVIRGKINKNRKMWQRIS